MNQIDGSIKSMYNNRSRFNRTRGARYAAYISTSSRTSGLRAVTQRNDGKKYSPPTIRYPSNVESITVPDPEINQASSYTDNLNAWINTNHILSDSGQYHRSTGKTGAANWYYKRSVNTTSRLVSGEATSYSLRVARDLVNRMIIDELQISVQMEHEAPKESVQGLAIQESDKESNTIVTRDEGKTETTVMVRNDCLSLASSEPAGSFEMLTKRWMPLDPIEVRTTHSIDTNLAVYYLPNSLYDVLKQSANLVPFETFIYVEMDITFKFVVNANKFQCGKVLASAKFDSFQADAVQSSVRSALHRPHVMLDLSSNNEGDLHVPFRYHRALIRITGNTKSNRGVRPAKYATVLVQVLSPLRTGLDNATNMYIRPFVKFDRVRFCGISHRVTLQMEGALGTVASTVLPALLGGVESHLTSAGTTPNRDKPTDVQSTIVVPQPRYNFATGKGATDARQLRMNPTTMTSYNCIAPYPDDPTNTLAIAQIWGLRATFPWGASNKPGELLYHFTPDPCSRTYGKRYVGVPTPLEYISSMYNFWSGTTELRLDFISNMFHTGSVQISVEFNRPSDDVADEKQSSSTYTKTFHLGEQKSCHMTIPYIYDTIWRRSTSLPYNPPLLAALTNRTEQREAMAIYPLLRTVVSVRVINELRPVHSAPQEIDVLVYWRASPSYRVHSLVQSSMYTGREATKKTSDIDNFPHTYAKIQDEEPARNKRETNDAGAEPRELPTDEGNQYNEYNEETVPSDQDQEIISPPADDTETQMENMMEDIVLQMDQGVKEDLDTTDDFSIGTPALTAQTVDEQHNIKDILRRPTLLIFNEEVSGLYYENSHAFFIPLMPPSRNLGVRSTLPGTIFADGLGQTPQSQLMNLFRFWRGSMRYTIIVEENKYNVPIYVTHIPHSGTRYIGNHIVGSQNQGAARNAKSFTKPIFGTGMSTEILLGEVNPSLQVEVPFDTENNWCLTFEEDPGRSVPWRDKGDTNVGHLAISCYYNAKITVFWSAGDDFEVANFYGIPGCNNNDATYAITDVMYEMESEDYDSSKEDFHIADEYVTGYNVDKVCGKYKEAAIMGAAALASNVPIVGPTINALNMFRMSTKITACTDDISKTSQSVRGLSGKLSDQVDNVQSLVAMLHEKLVAAFTSITSLPNRVSGLMDAANDLLLDLAFALVFRSWQVAASSLVRLFVKYVGFKHCIDQLFQLVPTLAATISKFFQQDISLQAPTTESTMAGLCAALVGLAFNVVIDRKPYESVFSKIVSTSTSSSSIAYINQSIRLFNTIFDTLKEMVMQALGYLSPEAHALRMFSTNSKLVEVFIKDAQYITCEANANLMALPSFRTKFWLTMTNAYQINALLCKMPSNAASAPLARLCSDVIKLGNEKMVDLTACPVRFEPFSYCIEGKAGIGKSFLNEQLGMAMLKGIDYNRPSCGINYIRQPGSDHWSGLRDQPIITYDDMFNLNDTQITVTTLKELYQIKSPCTFIPDMAHLEDKRIKPNPFILAMLCNDAFPRHIMGVVLHKVAVLRRRNAVIQARLKEGWTVEKVEALSGEESARFVHLEFCFHKNPRDDMAGYEGVWHDWDAFVNIMVSRFVKYYEREMGFVKRRIRDLQSCLTSIPPEEINLENPFKIFWEANIGVMEKEAHVDGLWLPSEQLSLSIQEACSLVEEGFKKGAIDVPGDDIQPQMGLAIVDPVQHAIACFKDWCANSSIFYERCCECCQLRPIVSSCCAPENTHKYCSGCITAQASPNICGKCNLGMRITVNTPHFVATLRSMRDFAIDEISAVITAVTDLDCFRAFQLLLQLEIFTLGMERFVPGSSLFVVIGAYTRYVLNRPPVHTHTDPVTIGRYKIWINGDDEQAIEQLSFADLNERLAIVEPNMSRFPEFQSLAKMEGLCLHTAVFDAMSETTTTYTAPGRWRAVTTLGGVEHWIEVDDAPCLRECMLGNSDSCHQFYSRWCIVRRKELVADFSRYLTMQWGNAQYRERVPFMIRPKWMSPPKFDHVTNWWEYVSEKFHTHKVLISVLLGAATATAAVYGLTRVFSMLGSEPIDIQNKLYATENVKHLRRVHKNARIRGQKQLTKTATVKLQAEDEHHEQVRAMVRSNLVCIRVWDGNTLKRTLGAVGICGKAVLLPKHYCGFIFSTAKKGYTLTVERAAFVQEGTGPALVNHTRHTYTLDQKDFTMHDTTDLCFFNLPNSFPCFRNIMKHIAKDEDIDTYLPHTGTIEIVPTSSRRFIDSREVDLFDLCTEVTAAKDQPGEEILRDVVSYNFSQPGTCGSILITHRSQRPILSMHSAGSESRNLGYGTIITQELLNEILPHQPILEMEDLQLVDISECESCFLLEPEAKVEYIGVVEPGQEHYSPHKTKLRESLVHNVGKLKSLTEPTILAKSDPRYTHEMSPLYYGVSKHGIRSIDPPSSVLDGVVEALWHGWFSGMRPCIINPQTLSAERAVIGFPELEYYDTIKLVTSAGYPWTVRNRKVTTKEAWINIERDENMKAISAAIHSDVLAEIDRKDALRRQGIQPCTIFADTLKDERKLSSKIHKKGATRVFCASPVDYTISTRQHLLHFCAAYMRERFGIMSGVGINAKGYEWTDLYRYLRSIGSDNIVALDYSNFGPAFNAVMAKAATRLIKRWCVKYVKDCDTEVVDMLLAECVNSVHIVQGTVYQQFSGSPSGAPITTIINSVVNTVHVATAWVALVSPYLDPDEDPWESFRHNVRLVVYGDDLIMNVSSEWISVFNSNTIRNYFAQFNIVATSSDKDNASAPDCVPIAEATFLKRGFAPHPVRHNTWLSPLAWPSINDATQWIWSCADHRAATLINCESALHEAHGHGPKIYAQFLTDINDALRQVGIREGITLSWERLDNLFFSDYEVTDVDLQMERPSSLSLCDSEALEFFVTANRAALALQNGEYVQARNAAEALLWLPGVLRSEECCEFSHGYDPDNWMNLDEEAISNIALCVYGLTCRFILYKYGSENSLAFKAACTVARETLELEDYLWVVDGDEYKPFRDFIRTIT